MMNMLSSPRYDKLGREYHAIDHAGLPVYRKLGKHRPRLDQRTLKLARYLIPTNLPAPKEVDWTTGLVFGMDGNDQAGDCVFAGGAHMEQAWTAAAGQPVLAPTAQDVIAAYSAFTGYDPAKTDANGDNPTDNGTDMLSFLKTWLNVGFFGRKIGGFAAIDTNNLGNIRLAIQLFGGAFAGWALPRSAQGQTVWDVIGSPGYETAPGSWGGHCAPLGSNGARCKAETWGSTLEVTDAFILEYMDECYAIWTPDFVAGDGCTPSGFDLPALQADLQALKAA